MIFLVFIPIIAFVYIYINRQYSSLSSRFPPGPWNFPKIGNLHWLAPFPWKYFREFGSKYGPIAHIKLGKTRAFLLNDTETWKEAYSRPELSRMAGKLLGNILENKSIIFGDGNPELKRSISSALSHFGKDTSEDLTSQEVKELIQKLENSRENPIRADALFQIPTVNMLWTLLFGKRIKEEDNEMHELAKAVHSFSKDSSFFGRQSILLMIPYMPKIMPSRIKRTKKMLLHLAQVMRKHLEEHVRTRNSSEIRSITDIFLMEEDEADSISNTVFEANTTRNSLHLAYTGLFIAAVDSTSTALVWLILFMATNLPAQKKFQEEIDDVLGNQRPSLVNRSRMPYTLAAIEEMLRLSSIDIGLLHQAKENTKLLGYDIPKGSVLVPNVYGINRNPEVWGDPDIFRPDRFIDADGKFRKGQNFIAFGCGKRSCPGESIARNQIFLFSTSIFQQFNVKLHGYVPSYNGDFGILHHPHPFEVVFVKRSIT